jgi:agmatinase
MNDFDPNAAALKNSGIFGLPYTLEDAKLVLLPVPWEATTSYGGGTSLGPKAILAASKQIDLFDLELGNFYELGIAMANISNDVESWNEIAQQSAQLVISADEMTPKVTEALTIVNNLSLKVNDYVYTETKKLLSQNKRVGIVGGDHSSPFGAIQAFLEHYPQMGILHFDAHADIRECFEGFEYSHASIMYNVLTKTPLSKLVQVGIRDFCEAEFKFINNNNDRVITFFDEKLQERKLSGESWSLISDEIIEHLPQHVYISFDIDGLDPRYCPHTGTPVPGGLDFSEALLLIKRVSQSGRKIIGFDLNEVSPGLAGLREDDDDQDPSAEWDANVGARLLYKLCGRTLI